MATKTISRKALQDIITQAHSLSYRSFGAMFLEKHWFKQGHYGNDGGLYIEHGYETLDETIVPISKLVVGAKLKEKHPLRQAGVLSIPRLAKQSFVGGQAWLADDVQVTVKKFMEHVARFLMDNEQHVEVFAGIYENKLTNTNVFGVYIMLKEEYEKPFAWEITIDDHDLVTAMSDNCVFMK